MSGGAPSLQFDPVQHTYRLDGEVLPSVTTILAILNRFEYVDPTVLEAARQRGTLVHAILAGCGQPIPDSATPYVEAGRQFLLDSGLKVVNRELRLASSHLGYAGTCDLVGVLNGKLSLLDWKCTTSVPRSVGPQTWAYAQLYREVQGDPIARRFCVVLAPYQYRLHALRDPRDAVIFQSCLNVWRFCHG